jgi:glycolate dehydrogenase FAD-binding subunit
VNRAHQDGSRPDAPDRASGRARSRHQPSTPSTLAEASATLAAAHADGSTLRIGADLSTENLHRILEHEAGDLTCTVEAGVRLSTLQAALEPYGQRLSLDPPGDPTIGALLAENGSGPLRHRFGAPRDLVLGVTLVLADGTIASSGGKVVKNVAGYDLARLVCGSHGRLALIVRASFRLHPLPKAAQTLAVKTDDPAAAARALLASQLQPSALDILHPGGLLVLFEGSPGAVSAQVEAAHGLVGGVEVGPEAWETSRRRQAEARGRLRFDPGRLAGTLADLDEAVVRPAAGVAYTPADNESRGPEPAVATLIERIRERFDPKGVLAA